MRAQFRVEALNAFNTVQFSGPNTSVTSTSFGVITGQANGAAAAAVRVEAVVVSTGETSA